MTLSAGTKLGPYEIVAPLGADGTVEPRVTSLENLSHPARAERRDDFVGTELIAGRQRHGLVFQFSVLNQERAARGSGQPLSWRA